MAQHWFVLSVKDGGLTRAKPPANAKPFPWIERDVENLVALNPSFLELESYVPLRLQGVRGMVASPDQAFVDELGRIAVVEMKKTRASLPVSAQVSGYAAHWQALPPGEIQRELSGLLGEKSRITRFGDAFREVAQWASGESNLADTDRLGRLALARLNPFWAVKMGRVRALIDQDGEQLPCKGAPPRMIAVAPAFTDECIEFAEQLTERMVALELVEVEVVKAGGRVYVGRRFAHRDPELEPTWRLFREAMEIPLLRKSFVVNGWADCLTRESFSLSARGALHARVWIWASETKAVVWTTVPSRWYGNDSRERKRLRAAFLDALPVDVDRSEVWPEWTFKMPEERKEAIQCIADVAEAIQSVLVPAADAAIV